MGIRNRTPIGTLREQRKTAERIPEVDAAKAKAPVRVRAHKLPDDTMTSFTPEKTDHLIERLRTVLKTENSRTPEGSSSDYLVIQDELARISQHHQLSRAEQAKDLVDLEAPRRHIETASPFRYVVIDGGKQSEDFETIARLDRAPSNFDSYTRQLPKDPAPRLTPLTLLISDNDSEPKARAQSPADPSQEAASLTQSSVTYQERSNAKSVLPKSLILSLLGDN